MDQKSSKAPDVNRRGFMRLAGLTAGSAGAAAAGLQSQPAAAAEAESSKVSAGYHESEHVKAYYAHARM